VTQQFGCGHYTNGHAISQVFMTLLASTRINGNMGGFAPFIQAGNPHDTEEWIIRRPISPPFKTTIIGGVQVIGS
jgi:hypothetical protein